MPETILKQRPGNGRPTNSLDQAVAHVRNTSNRLLEEVSKVIVGKKEVMRLVMVDILAQGNILFEDFPGLAKTVMANTFALASGCDFKRIQFTPDVLPSDITGSYVFDQNTAEFTFRPGPVFCNFLLGDEINRAPPKTQSAMLEAMQERQVSIEGRTHKLGKPFVVMATQNPVEQEGTYPLPEAQMDRFLMRLSVGYPSTEDEAEIARRRISRGKDDFDVEQVTNPQDLLRMQDACEHVHIDPSILHYIARIITATRDHPDTHVGSSPRGTLGLVKAARASAALNGRTFVSPDDVRGLAIPVLAHRIILTPDARFEGRTGADVIRDIIKRIKAPTV